MFANIYPSLIFRDNNTYFAGIYADYNAFSVCVLGTEDNISFIMIDEIYNSEFSSNGLIHKAIKELENKYNLLSIKINKNLPLNNYLEEHCYSNEIYELEISDCIYQVKSMLIDGLLKIPDNQLAESFTDELEKFKIDIVSHRINALAIALSGIDPYILFLKSFKT